MIQRQLYFGKVQEKAVTQGKEGDEEFGHYCLKQYSSPHKATLAQAVEKMWWKNAARSHSLLPPAGNTLDGDLRIGWNRWNATPSSLPWFFDMAFFKCDTPAHTHIHPWGFLSTARSRKLQDGLDQVFSANSFKTTCGQAIQAGNIYSIHPCLGTN